MDITCPAKLYLASSSREATCAGATFAKSYLDNSSRGSTCAAFTCAGDIFAKAHLASNSRAAQLGDETGASSRHGATCAGSACPAKPYL